jgi:ParB-like chromosome segregation protein Spo0J
MTPQIEAINIADLIPYARNSRTHSDEQVAQIAASIQEFGFTNPVLIDADGGIIAGHGRVMAARKLGRTDVPCIRLGHLTEIQKRAYIIADNKLALNSSWDGESLQIELLALNDDSFKMELLGFDANELNLAMGLGADFLPGDEEDQGKLDEKSPISCPSCGHEFHK